jgi:RNA polymerase sigma-B factor
MKGVHEVVDRPHPISQSPRQQLWDANYGLAISLARRFAMRARGESVEDLTQVASIGLIRAIERYDSTRGVPFTAFAAATIVGELKHHLRDSCWMVRPSRRVQDMYLRVAEEQRGLVLELGRDPTPAELGERVGATPDDVIEALQAGRPAALRDIPGLIALR